MACQASARVARGWIVLSGGPPSRGLRLMIRVRGKVLSFWICLCFTFLAITAIGCVGAMCGFLRGGPAAAGLSPLLFLFPRSGRRPRRWSNTILGRDPWRFGGWRLAECERWGSGLAVGWAAGGRSFAGCWVGAILGRLEAAAELERLGRCVGRLLCVCEALSKALYCRTKQASGRDRGVEEGDFIRILHLRQV